MNEFAAPIDPVASLRAKVGCGLNFDYIFDNRRHGFGPSRVAPACLNRSDYDPIDDQVQRATAERRIAGH